MEDFEIVDEERWTCGFQLVGLTPCAGVLRDGEEVFLKEEDNG